jgi:nucleoid DNA-binding protein
MASRAKGNKPPTKAQTTALMAGKSGLTKAQVTSVMTALEEAIQESLRRHKEFNLFGMLKVTIAHKKARPARPGRNPATGEMMTFKAKPAHDVVKVRVLKRLKDMA